MSLQIGSGLRRSSSFQVGSGFRRSATFNANPAAAAAYTAQAVNFDGLTYLVNAALASSDNHTAAFSCWVKLSTSTFPAIYVVDPENNYINTLIWMSDTGAIRNRWFNSDGSSAVYVDDTPAVATEAWHHIVGSANSDTPIATLYIDDVRMLPALNVGSSFTIAFNGFSFWIGSDSYGDNLIGSLADLWVAPGVSLLDGGGDIPLATRRKFISGTGTPVSLGANGELPTGTAPAVFFSGNAAAWAAGNLGTGGSFAVTGTLTDAGTHP